MIKISLFDAELDYPAPCVYIVARSDEVGHYVGKTTLNSNRGHKLRSNLAIAIRDEDAPLNSSELSFIEWRIVEWLRDRGVCTTRVAESNSWKSTLTQSRVEDLTDQLTPVLEFFTTCTPSTGGNEEPEVLDLTSLDKLSQVVDRAGNVIIEAFLTNTRDLDLIRELLRIVGENAVFQRKIIAHSYANRLTQLPTLQPVWRPITNEHVSRKDRAVEIPNTGGIFLRLNRRPEALASLLAILDLQILPLSTPED